MFTQPLMSTRSSLVDHFLLEAGFINPGELATACGGSQSGNGLLCEASREMKPEVCVEKGSMVLVYVLVMV